ncbi:MAG: hypothetical protein ACKO0Z_05750 [Betaproteobacteria bacterium]
MNAKYKWEKLDFPPAKGIRATYALRRYITGEMTVGYMIHEGKRSGGCWQVWPRNGPAPLAVLPATMTFPEAADAAKLILSSLKENGEEQ